MKLDFEIAVDQQTRARERTFEGVHYYSHKIKQNLRIQGHHGQGLHRFQRGKSASGK